MAQGDPTIDLSAKARAELLELGTKCERITVETNGLGATVHKLTLKYDFICKIDKDMEAQEKRKGALEGQLATPESQIAENKGKADTARQERDVLEAKRKDLGKSGT